MIQSNYKIKSIEDPTLGMKKKLLARPEISETVPDVEDINSEIQGNKPAYTKKQVDKSQAYKNSLDSQITGGDYKEELGTEKISKAALNDEDTTMGKTANAVAAGAGGLLDMTTSVMMQKGPMNKEERNANTMSMASKGMSTGSAIGSAFGPMGTLVGAGAGLVAGIGTGLIQGIGDQKKLDEEAKIKRATNLDNIKDKREKDQRIADGKDVIEKKKNILKSQMGVLGSNYSQTKIS